MKPSTLIAAFLVLSFFSTVYPADLVNQKVGIFAEKGGGRDAAGYYLVEAVLEKAGSASNIVILPASAEELRLLGVKELNAQILLYASRSNNGVAVSLFAGTNTNTAPIGPPLYAPGGLSEALPVLVPAIISDLAAAYPPKVKSEITVYEIIHESGSTLERENPTFSLRVSPMFYSDYRFDLMVKPTANGVSNGNNNNNNPVNIGPDVIGFSLFMAGAALNWRFFHSTLDIGFDFLNPGRAFYAGWDAGFGLFSSVLILGLHAHVNYQSLKSDGSMVPVPVNTNGFNYTVNIHRPDISVLQAGFGPYIVFNVSKSYYILFLFPVLEVWNSYSFVFHDSFMPQGALNVDNNLTLSQLGAQIVLSMELFPKNRLLFHYQIFSQSIQDAGNHNLGSSGNVDFLMQNVLGQRISLGAGYEYEF